jgi:predicted GNAT superfamily acetyltransferase
MTADVRELTELQDLRRLTELFADIWGRSGEPPVTSDILRALTHSRNYVAAAFADQRMVGGLVGWLGGKPPSHLLMHSHILGVLPGSEARGVGFDLKQHQRRWCLARQVKVMEWTTDPLIRRNVYFNLAKLGAQAPEYLVDFYGEMPDAFNAGDESDRLLIRWRLEAPRTEEAAAGVAAELDVEKLRQWGADAIVAVGPRGEPVIGNGSSRVLLCQVPDDIVAVRRVDPGLAREWRLALRHALSDALARDYVISGATRSGWYVLESTTT